MYIPFVNLIETLLEINITIPTAMIEIHHANGSPFIRCSNTAIIAVAIIAMVPNERKSLVPGCQFTSINAILE
jgi:hypothetical protein